jgi:hypothetical protein
MEFWNNENKMLQYRKMPAIVNFWCKMLVKKITMQEKASHPSTPSFDCMYSRL